MLQRLDFGALFSTVSTFRAWGMEQGGGEGLQCTIVVILGLFFITGAFNGLSFSCVFTFDPFQSLPHGFAWLYWHPKLGTGSLAVLYLLPAWCEPWLVFHQELIPLWAPLLSKLLSTRSPHIISCHNHQFFLLSQPPIAHRCLQPSMSSPGHFVDLNSPGSYFSDRPAQLLPAGPPFIHPDALPSFPQPST